MQFLIELAIFIGCLSIGFIGAYLANKTPSVSEQWHDAKWLMGVPDKDPNLFIHTEGGVATKEEQCPMCGESAPTYGNHCNACGYYY